MTTLAQSSLCAAVACLDAAVEVLHIALDHLGQTHLPEKADIVAALCRLQIVANELRKEIKQ